MFRIEMFFGGNRANKDDWFEYGTYSDRDQANEVAMWVRDERQCEVRVLRVD